MQQLSWTDDMMLRAERPETPMQIQMLLIYDPATAPGGRVTFKGILEEIDARLHLAPTFRRRLTELPGGLHMPYWVDDPAFDLEYHVRHIALPQPGDWRQLCIQIARIHCPADRPSPSAVGDDCHRGTEFGTGRSARSVRDRPQIAPFRRRRDGKRRADGRHARPRPRRPAPQPTRNALGARSTAFDGEPRVTDCDQRRALSVARKQGDDTQRAEGGRPIDKSARQIGRWHRLHPRGRFRFDLRSDHSVQRFGHPRIESSRHASTTSPTSSASRRACRRRRSTTWRWHTSVGPFVATSKGTVSCRTRHSSPPVPRRSETPMNKAVEATGCSAGCSRW